MITTQHPLRHPLQAMVSLGQIYGDILYYATSMFDHYYLGITYSRPEAYYFWGYYFLMNFFWIVIPGRELYSLFLSSLAFPLFFFFSVLLLSLLASSSSLCFLKFQSSLSGGANVCFLGHEQTSVRLSVLFETCGNYTANITPLFSLSPVLLYNSVDATADAFRQLQKLGLAKKHT